MKYLVTGGAGFIGSNIVMELLKRGEEIRVLDNFSTGNQDNLTPVIDRIELIEGDIRSYQIVKKAVSGIDVILHQAALPSVHRSIKDPITTNEVNVLGTLNVIESARHSNVKRVVFASSSSIYGDSDELPKHENMIPKPLSPYAISKLSAEKYCQVFTKLYNLHTVCLRYFNVFGPMQDPDSQYSAVIPKFIKTIMKDEQPVIFGDGEQSRDFTYVTNIVEANILASKEDCEPGIVLNCACQERTTLNQLVSELNGLFNKNIIPKYLKPRPGDVKHSMAAIDLAKKKIKYVPIVNFKEGLQRTVEWYLNRKN